MKKHLMTYTLIFSTLFLLSGCFGNAEGYGGHKPPSTSTADPQSVPSSEGSPTLSSLADAWFLLSDTPNSACPPRPNTPNHAGFLTSTKDGSYFFYKDACSAAVSVSNDEVQLFVERSVAVYKNKIFQQTYILNPVKVLCSAKDQNNALSLELYITKKATRYDAYASLREVNVSESIQREVVKTETPEFLEYAQESEILLKIPKPLQFSTTIGSLRIKLPQSTPLDAEMQCRVTEPILLN